MAIEQIKKQKLQKSSERPINFNNIKTILSEDLALENSNFYTQNLKMLKWKAFVKLVLP